jgi:hypothetical protein
MVKSTYVNELRTGSFWICHNEYHIVLNNSLKLTQKNDVVIILGFIETMFKDVKVVECHSQKMNIVFSTTIEDFYFNYNKL